MATKLINALTWEQLTKTFFIGLRMTPDVKRDKDGKPMLDDKGNLILVKIGHQVNELQEAIDSGRLDLLVKECADEMHGGDTSAVYRTLSKNIASKRCHLKKVSNKELEDYKRDMIMLQTLEKWLEAHIVSRRADAGVIPQWAYGPAEIDAINDVDRLQKVINSIADVCSDKAGPEVYVPRLGEDYVETAKENRAYARQRMAELQAKAELASVDANLLKKLTGGKKVSLSPEEALALVKLLGNR